MPNSNLFYIISILICLFLSGFFSSSETAYTSFNRNKMKALANDGNKRAALVLRLSESYDKLLSTILVGNNVVNISMSSIATLFFVKLLTGTPLDGSGPALSTVVLTVVVLIFGEISPKSLAKDRPEAFAMACARPLQWLTVLLTPVNAFFMLWKKLLSKIFKKSDADTVTEGEVLTLVDEAHEDGSIDAYDKELIENIFDFDDLTAGEIATHRTDLLMLSTEDGLEEWDRVIHNSRFSRYPVYGERVDDIIGILDARAYLRLENRTREDINSVIHPAYFVPENVKLDILFRNMKKAKEVFAIVLDEHGGTTGIVTMTDLIECLVGVFNTEEAGEVCEQEMEQVDECLWLIRGDALLSDVNKKLGISIAEEEADTLSGYILGLNGSVPDDGSTLELETDRLKIKALRIKDHTVERAEIYIKKPLTPEETDNRTVKNQTLEENSGSESN